MKNITEKHFDKILKLFSQPVKASDQTKSQKKNDNYNGKRTHQHKIANTSD